MSELFRPQVAHAQSAQFMGSIRIGRNPSFDAVALLSLLLALCLVAFGVLGQVTRKSKVPGLLIPAQGAIHVVTQVAGVVSEVEAVEGQRVDASRRLFTLNTDRAGSGGDTAQLVAAALKHRAATLESERALRTGQAALRTQAVKARIRDLTLEIDAAKRESDLAGQRVSLARKTLERFESLSASGFVSEVQLQQRQEDLLDLQARRDAAVRTATALSRELAATKAELSNVESQLATELVQLERAMAGLSQERVENEARKSLMVTAPQEGYVATVNVSKGSAVQPGQVLATFIPAAAGQASSLEAHLFAPSRSAGFVQPGQTAWLRLAAYPYQKFGMTKGVVTEVSTTPLSPQDLPPGQSAALLQAAQASEPLYRIKVSLQSQTLAVYGHQQRLKPGMALEADVIQDRRAVWEWLLEPILATRKKLQVLSG